ncbi:hypothetical protein ACLB2K_039238 [Fragaria x ananassa]
MIIKEGKFGDDFIGLLLKARYNPDENQRITVDDVIDECETFTLVDRKPLTLYLLIGIFYFWQCILIGKTARGSKKGSPAIIWQKQTTINSHGLAKLKTTRNIVPANVELHVPNLAFHHDPQLWGEDVHLFKPERFSEGVAKATNSHSNMVACLPFGMGPRNSVGFNFATTEAKIVLSMILQRYSFSLSPGYVRSPFKYTTVRPQHGVMLHPL